MRKRYLEKSGGLLFACLIVSVLYFARDIFVPLALATLMAFLLEPLSRRLERYHLGRMGSVLLAIFAVVIAGCVMGLAASKQLGQLAGNIPEYKNNIHTRLQRLRDGDEGLARRAIKSIQDLRAEIAPTNSPVANNAAGTVRPGDGASKPIPVEVHNQDQEQIPLRLAQAFISPSLSFLLKLILVVVFCIFMLVGREDLRTRLIHVVGQRHLKLTVHMLEETNNRLSRYLLTQFAVNVAYGIAIGMVLWLVGLPNPFLWSISTALFRYIPYAGPWIGASLPFAIALAVDSGWAKPLIVLAVFATFEIITSNFVEPWLYGRSTGITSFAVLLAAVFWTWLWGPVGLLLSMPLTVTLVSVARYFPELEIIDQLFGKSPGLNKNHQ